MRYKNLTLSTCVFYGVTFKPGEIHSVPGAINHPKFVRVNDKDNSKPSLKSESKPTDKGVSSLKVTTKESKESKDTPDSKDSKDSKNNSNESNKQGGITNGTNQDK